MNNLKVLSFNGDDKEETMAELESLMTKCTNSIQVQNGRLTDSNDEAKYFSETQTLDIDCAHFCLVSLLGR